MNTIKNYKIILADDHVLLRDALAGLIDNFDEFTVIAKVANGIELTDTISAGTKPDILLMDLNMPKMDGYDTARWIAKHHRDVKMVVLTMYDTEVAMIRMLQIGVCGFLKKDIHPEELKRALLAVAAGEYYYSNDTTIKIASLFRKKTGGKFPLETMILNENEIEFLKLAATDMTYKEIAAAMGLTPRYIDSYRDNLFTKLDVQSRVGLAIYAIKTGIVTL
jgi:DNA-binding NarL/FixJ family response regulator